MSSDFIAVWVFATLLAIEHSTIIVFVSTFYWLFIFLVSGTFCTYFSTNLQWSIFMHLLTLYVNSFLSFNYISTSLSVNSYIKSAAWFLLSPISFVCSPINFNIGVNMDILVFSYCNNLCILSISILPRFSLLFDNVKTSSFNTSKHVSYNFWNMWGSSLYFSKHKLFKYAKALVGLTLLLFSERKGFLVWISDKFSIAWKSATSTRDSVSLRTSKNFCADFLLLSSILNVTVTNSSEINCYLQFAWVSSLSLVFN